MLLFHRCFFRMSFCHSHGGALMLLSDGADATPVRFLAQEQIFYRIRYQLGTSQFRYTLSHPPFCFLFWFWPSLALGCNPSHRRDFSAILFRIPGLPYQWFPPPRLPMGIGFRSSYSNSTFQVTCQYEVHLFHKLHKTFLWNKTTIKINDNLTTRTSSFSHF